MTARPFRRDPANAGAALLTVAAAAGMTWSSVYRHGRFGSNAYDLGIFDQAVWAYSRLEWLPNTILRLPHVLGDHFHPILVVLAPLYWVWDDVRVLLAAQAVLLASAGIPIYLWARDQLGAAAALLFQAAYLVFWAVLGGSIFDFHEIALAAPIVSGALYATLTRRTALLWAFVVLGLLTREDVALTFVGLAVFVAVVQRRWRLAGAVAAASVAWFVLALKVVIPAIAGRAYAHWAYSQLGPDPLRAFAHLVLHPLESLRTFFTPGEKRLALANLFLPWLGLPLVSPLVLVALPNLAARFFSDKPSHWAPQGFHYSLVLAPVLAFAAVDTTRRVVRRVGRERLGAVVGAAVLLAGLWFSFGRLRPLDELRRYATGEQVAAIEGCLRTIPPDASVSATSALVPHLSHRREIYVLDDRPLPETEYYALDLATWTFPFDRDDAVELVESRLARGYGVACSRGYTAVLVRGGPRREVSPELRRLLGL